MSCHTPQKQNEEKGLTWPLDSKTKVLYEPMDDTGDMDTEPMDGTALIVTDISIDYVPKRKQSPQSYSWSWITRLASKSRSHAGGSAFGLRMTDPAWSHAVMQSAVMQPAVMKDPAWIKRLLRRIRTIRIEPGKIAPRATSGSGDTTYRVDWLVDARILEKKDKTICSPRFELCFGPRHPNVIFQSRIYPTVIHEGKGGSCFKSSKGEGSLALWCGSEFPSTVSWQVGVSDGTQDGVQMRGPVVHNFADKSVSRLSKESAELDFKAAVDPSTKTFVVRLEIQQK